MSVPSSIPPRTPPTAPPFAEALDVLSKLLPAKLLKPRVGIVCGSGLSTLAKSLRDVVEVPYDRLPGFGINTVQGHRSALAFGLVGEGEGVPVVAMLGRVRHTGCLLLGSANQPLVPPVRGTSACDRRVPNSVTREARGERAYQYVPMYQFFHVL